MIKGTPNKVAFALGAILSLSATNSWAQNTSPQAATNAAGSDDGSSKVISHALELLGSDSIYASIKDVTLQGNCKGIHATSDADSTQFEWRFAGREYRYEVRGSGLHTIEVSGHGHPSSSWVDGTHVRAIRTAEHRFQIPYYLPGLVLYRALHNSRSNFAFTKTTNSAIANVAAAEVTITQNDNQARVIPSSEQHWYIDKKGLPAQVDVFVLASIPGQRPLSVQFSDYKSFSGILVPSTMTTSTAGQIHGTCTIETVDLNTNPSADMFDLAKKQ